MIVLTISAVSFMVRYGGNQNDEAYAGVIAPDSGYAAGGIWMSYGTNGDFAFVRLSPTGNMMFAKLIGTSAEDRAYGLTVSPWGYVLAGRTTNAGYDALVVSLDNSGNFQWAKYIGTSFDDYPYWITQSSDGNVIASGYSVGFGYAVWFFKLDASGNLIWSKTLNYADPSMVREVREDANGRLMFAGRISSGGNIDGLTIRTDNMGNPLWSLRVDIGNQDWFYSISQTPSGDYCVGGYTDVSGNTDIVVLRVDTLGNIKWVKLIGGGSNDEGFGITYSPDDGCVVVGYTFSYSHDAFGFEDAIIVKLDNNGNLVWARIFWGTNFGDVGNDVDVAPDGGYLSVGNSYKLVGFSTRSDFFVVKTLPDGTVCAGNSAVITPNIWTPSYTVDNTLPTLNDRTSSTTITDAPVNVQNIGPATTASCTPLGDDDDLSVGESFVKSCGKVLRVYSVDGKVYNSLNEAPKGIIFLKTDRGIIKFFKRF
ncbi:MAG: hypothetical protein ABIL23_04380 [candidate division WOR-3 bacterium]